MWSFPIPCLDIFLDYALKLYWIMLPFLHLDFFLNFMQVSPMLLQAFKYAHIMHIFVQVAIWLKGASTYNIGPQAFNVHLFCLLLEGLLVGHYSLYNLWVEVDDGEHGEDVVEDKGIENEALVVPVLTQVVVAARN